jgi:hypothetical protein
MYIVHHFYVTDTLYFLKKNNKHNITAYLSDYKTISNKKD